MSAGYDHVRTIGELVYLELNGTVTEVVGRKVGWFIVVDDGFL